MIESNQGRIDRDGLRRRGADHYQSDDPWKEVVGICHRKSPAVASIHSSFAPGRRMLAHRVIRKQTAINYCVVFLCHNEGKRVGQFIGKSSPEANLEISISQIYLS
jgi:hypothetical protein